MHPITITLIYANLVLALAAIAAYGVSQSTASKRMHRKSKKWCCRFLVVLTCSCVLLGYIDHIDRFSFYG